MIVSKQIAQASRIVAVMSTLACLLGAGSAQAGKAEKNAAKRAEIDAMAKETLKKVTSENAGAKKLLGQAAGYAVFDNFQTSLALAGGKGVGVAVDKASDDRTYMKMKTLGVKLGLGIQKYQVVFLFQTKERFDRFVNDGWEVESGADASAGDEGVSVDAKWSNGVASYQITEKGLMLSVDLSGTKYYPAKKLN